MSLWEAAVRAGVTTLVIIAIVSWYERKFLWFPVIAGVVSLFAGYLTDSATVGALSYLVVYAVLAHRHPMRARQLKRDEEAWQSHRHQDPTT